MTFRKFKGSNELFISIRDKNKILENFLKFRQVPNLKNISTSKSDNINPKSAKSNKSNPLNFKSSADPYRFNSHATKKFTPHNSSWSCEPKDIDFAILTRDRAMPEWWAIANGRKSRNIYPNSHFRFDPLWKTNFRFKRISPKCSESNFRWSHSKPFPYKKSFSLPNMRI